MYLAWPRPLPPRLYAALAPVGGPAPSLPPVPGHRPVAGVAGAPPAVPCEGGADGEVLEEAVPAQEVHAERQVVGAQALRLHPPGA